MADNERKAIKSFDDRSLDRLEKLCGGQDALANQLNNFHRIMIAGYCSLKMGGEAFG